MRCWVDRFRAAVDGLSLPVVAGGGITAENAAGVLAAGAIGVAAIRPFQDAAVAAFRAADLRRALDRAGGTPS